MNRFNKTKSGIYISCVISLLSEDLFRIYLSRVMTKPTKWHVRPAKTQISMGICPVWSVFPVHMKKAWVVSYPLSAQRRHWSEWVDSQADLSLRWVHSHFVGFVMRQLISHDVRYCNVSDCIRLQTQCIGMKSQIFRLPVSLGWIPLSFFSKYYMHRCS